MPMVYGFLLLLLLALSLIFVFCFILKKKKIIGVISNICFLFYVLFANTGNC